MTATAKHVLHCVVLASLGVGLATLARCPAGAAELQILEGLPSPQQIEEALKPKGAAAPVRFRGITLGNQGGTPGAPAPPPTLATAAIAIGIQFDFNSAELTPQGRQILDNLAKALKSAALRASRFQLEGHTDSKGSDEYNQVLSQRRAASAKKYLVERHAIEPSQLATVGKGKREPLDPAHPERDVNRRVQILNVGS